MQIVHETCFLYVDSYKHDDGTTLTSDKFDVVCVLTTESYAQKYLTLLYIY
jgi:hypothetical protein